MGQRQRVEILKALYRDARILILDEPTAVLTPQETEDLFSVLGELVADGLSIILITHKLGELIGVADRITIIRDGKVVETVDASGTDEGELARLMVGREVLLRVEKGASEVGEPRLSAENLVVRSGTGSKAVDGVSLEVRAGRSWASPASTATARPSSPKPSPGSGRPRRAGSCLDGEDVTKLGAEARQHLGLAYVPEDRGTKGLVQDFALYENNALKTYDEPPFSRWGWIFPKAMRRGAAEALRAYDVQAARPRRPRRLPLRRQPAEGHPRPRAHRRPWRRSSPPSRPAAWTWAPSSSSTGVCWSSGRRARPSCSSPWSSRRSARSPTASSCSTRVG